MHRLLIMMHRKDRLRHAMCRQECEYAGQGSTTCKGSALTVGNCRSISRSCSGGLCIEQRKQNQEPDRFTIGASHPQMRRGRTVKCTNHHQHRLVSIVCKKIQHACRVTARLVCALVNSSATVCTCTAHCYSNLRRLYLYPFWSESECAILQAPANLELCECTYPQERTFQHREPWRTNSESAASWVRLRSHRPMPELAHTKHCKRHSVSATGANSTFKGRDAVLNYAHMHGASSWCIFMVYLHGVAWSKSVGMAEVCQHAPLAIGGRGARYLDGHSATKRAAGRQNRGKRLILL